MAENKDNRTATQRIEDLEKMVVLLYQSNSELVAAVQNFQRFLGDMQLVKDALKLLNRKTEAIVQAAAESSGITATSVSELVVKMNVEDLKNQVQVYLTSGQIEPTDSVTSASFVVCEESNSEGAVVNPRIQFRTDSVEEKVQKALLGAKVGDTVSFGENNFSAKVLEIYNLVPPKAPEQSTDTAAAPTAEADAPAATETATAEATPEAAPATSTELPSPPAETPVPVFAPSDFNGPQADAPAAQ